MKRVIAVVLAIVMICSLAACGGEKKAEKYCFNCGEGITKDAAFCEHCFQSFENNGNDSDNVSNPIDSELDSNPEDVNSNLSLPYDFDARYSLTDEFFNNIVDKNWGFFITDTGDLYQIDYDKLFSNEMHYKKIETDIKFVKFLNGYIVGRDNKLYSYDSDTLSFTINDLNYGKNACLKNEDLSKVFSIGRRMEEYTGYYTEYYKIKGNSIFSCDDNSCVYTFENETIEYAIDSTIKTNKGIYDFGEICINEEECYKYVDVKPIYELSAEPYDFPCEFIKFSNYTHYPWVIIKNNCLYESVQP